MQGVAEGYLENRDNYLLIQVNACNYIQTVYKTSLAIKHNLLL